MGVTCSRARTLPSNQNFCLVVNLQLRFEIVMKSEMLLIVGILAISGTGASQQNHKAMSSVAPVLRSRAGRLFFAATTTSTLSTSTVCFVTGTNAITTTCPGKRKRAIFTSPEARESSDLQIAPKRVERDMESEEGLDNEDPNVDDLEPGLKEVDHV